VQLIIGKTGLRRLFTGLVALALSCALPEAAVLAAEGDGDYAFPEKFMLRLSSYSIDSADTKVTALNDKGIGVGYSFSRDFDTDDSVTVPRIDMYYRINERHRIDFSTFSSERDGKKELTIEVELGDQVFEKGEILNSKISYDLYRLGYSYSFYHSDTVELAVSAGLNITKYDLKFSNQDGSEKEEADATAPLPMFGLQMGYAINSSWSLHYLMETFFIEIEDTYKGSFFNNEVTVQYRFLDNFLVGLGIARVAVDLDVDDNDWKGEVVDSYDGYLLFAGYYF
jgi:hypothetical protein